MAHNAQQHGKPVSDLGQAVNSSSNELHCLVIIIIVIPVITMWSVNIYDDDDDDDNNNKKCMLIDVAIPGDRNVIKKKFGRFQNIKTS